MKEGRSHCKNRKIKNFVTYRQNSSLIRMFKGKENKSAVNSNKNSKSNNKVTINKTMFLTTREKDISHMTNQSKCNSSNKSISEQSKRGFL